MSAPEIPGYRELRELGRGGGGRVVLAEHVPTGTRVAVKHLAARLAAEPEFVEAFRREARLLAELQHPNIVRLYEYVEGPHDKAIVMEYVEGASLRAVLAHGAPIPPEAALAVLQGSLTGLAAAHTRGVVHRDFKPDNVLVSAAGDSKLADFGIAARSGHAGPAMGTPKYTAPEQWAGAPADAAGDLYAATAVFFECVTGAPPFSGQDTESLRWEHDQAPVPLERVPERLRPLVARGLAKSPAERPADAGQFLAELREAATAAYGRSWEERGRGLLAELALLLLLRGAPGSQPSTMGPTPARTTLAPVTAARSAIPRGARHPRRIITTAAVGLVVTATALLVLRSTGSHGAAADASNALDPGAPRSAGAGGPEAGIAADPHGGATSQDPVAPAPTPTPSDPTTSTAAAPGTSAASAASTAPISPRTAGGTTTSPVHTTTSSPSASSRSSAPTSSSSSPVPTPPPARVLTMSAALVDDSGPGTAPIRATVTVTTGTTSPVTLTLCYADTLSGNPGPPWDDGPNCHAARILQGSTSYTISDIYNLPRVCTYAYAQVVATTVPAAPGGPVTTSFNPSAGCIF